MGLGGDSQFLRSAYLKTNTSSFTIEPMEGKDWQPVMDLGLELLDKHGVEWQLGSGTLLGIVREEDGYIHHDTDLDIDVICREDDPKKWNKLIGEVGDTFAKNGFRLIRTQYYKDLPMQIAFIHEKTNLIFDLCCFYEKWFEEGWYNIYEHGVFYRPDWSVGEVIGFKFNKKEYKVPKDYQTYLEGRYGFDWTVPKKGKDSGEKDAAHYLIVL